MCTDLHWYWYCIYMSLIWSTAINFFLVSRVDGWMCVDQYVWVSEWPWKQGSPISCVGPLVMKVFNSLFAPVLLLAYLTTTYQYGKFTSHHCNTILCKSQKQYGWYLKYIAQCTCSHNLMSFLIMTQSPMIFCLVLMSSVISHLSASVLWNIQWAG